jgi:23S rRNA pseudouridine1911/1915/1917 synthase
VIRFEAGPDEAGERVDVVLARRATVTRTLAQRALREGLITVSGRAVRPSQRLEEGDVVLGEVPTPTFAPPSAEDIPIEIRYRDPRVLVVSKPAGLVTHPARGHLEGTLVNALLGLGVPLAGEGSIRPGIVHRLDRDTSGLLLVALDDEAGAFLVDALRQRAVERRYLALVRGEVPAATGTIEAPIGRHPTKRRLMAVVAGGRPSVTHYARVDGTDSETLLDVSLETGRTHQIRVHLAHLGNPVLGDRVYGGLGEAARAVGLNRPFLHAWRLTFPHPDGGEPVTVKDELPDDLAEALSLAGLHPPLST